MSERRSRQAVVVVHGIGQQRPMSTVLSFVEGVTGEDDLVFGAPDRISGHRDLRCSKVTWLPTFEQADDDVTPPVTTDFYELYWAHLVQRTQLRHVTSWLVTVLKRFRRFNRRILKFFAYHLLYAAIIAGIGAAAFILLVTGRVPDQVQEAVKYIAPMLLAFGSGWIVWHLGDVPRYLNGVADNIPIQREIRREGLELLRRLLQQTLRDSTTPKYERVIVVGHSLGSAIAYDIVGDYWAEVNRSYEFGPDGSAGTLAAVTAVEDAGERLRTNYAGSAPPLHEVVEYQQLQRRLSAVMPRAASDAPGTTPTARWAVTDLITLACPLTHAEVLLAENETQLQSLQRQRALASCPPQRQTTVPSYRFGYRRYGQDGRTSLHQAAAFATTRWTNLYFPADVVGGPLQPHFGPGILDIELDSPPGLKGRMPQVHSQYVRRPDSIEQIRKVITDYGLRADRSTLDRQPTLEAVASEVIRLRASGATTEAVVRSLPTLSRLPRSTQALVEEVVAQYVGESPTELAEMLVERLGNLVLSIQVFDPSASMPPAR